jgi:phosphosulfolactate phosphohydrolase-like enzyme
MTNASKFTHEDWASWYERARTHTRVAPRLTEDLRAGTATAALLATAAATLAEMDDDIIAGEFLARSLASSGAGQAVEAIAGELSQIAQDLLQAIVEAKNGQNFWDGTSLP